MQEVFRTFASVLNSPEIDPSVREAFVFAAWKRTAGELLCEHAVPVRFEEAILSVAVTNAAWQKHLADLSPQMLFKLNSILGNGTVRRLAFGIDEAVVLKERSSGDDKGIEAELEALAAREIEGELKRTAGAIEDDDLRRTFLLAAGKCLAARNSGRVL